MYSAKIKEKDNNLNEVSEEVVRLRASWAQTLDEMKVLRSERWDEDKAMKKLRATSLKNAEKLKGLQSKCRMLEGEIITKQMAAADLEDKVGEYDAVITWMEMEFNAKESKYKSIIDYMDHYYKDKVEKLSPRYLRKHYVPNASGKGMPFCLSRHYFIFA